MDGSCGGESSRVNTHNAVTSTATRPALHSLLVPATDIFPLVCASCCHVIAARLSITAPASKRFETDPCSTNDLQFNSSRGFHGTEKGIPAPPREIKVRQQDEA